MAHFAKLDENNIVTFVTVGRDEDDGKELELSERTGETYKQTSYNTVGGVHLNGGTPFRKNYASIGSIYDSVMDAFYKPQPYPSWILDEQTCFWNPPVPYPTDCGTLENPKKYVWDESKLSWNEFKSLEATNDSI